MKMTMRFPKASPSRTEAVFREWHLIAETLRQHRVTVSAECVDNEKSGNIELTLHAQGA